MEKYLETGKIVSVSGLRGEVRAEPWCDTPSDLTKHKKLFFYKGETSIEVESARVSKNVVVLKLRGIDSVEEAQKLRGRILYVDRADLKLPAGTYFVADLIGMEVLDFETEKSYGTITDVTQTGANDVYHIKSEDGKMYYIPAIPDVVKETDTENSVMRITPLEGLFDE